MKKLAIFGVLSILTLINSFSMESSLASEYEVLDDTIFTNPHDVCIDPGHGGIYSGAVGPVYGVLEKNV